MIILCVGRYITHVWSVDRPWAGFPIASLPGSGLSPKKSFLKDARNTVIAGMNSHTGPFQVLTGTGPKIVLPNKFAEELRTRAELDFNEAFREDFFAHYPGFDGFRASLDNPKLIPAMLKSKLTQHLNMVTMQLAAEATIALDDLFGEDTAWHTVAIKQNNLDLIARLSSRVFLGKSICRDKRWLEIAKNHTGQPLFHLHVYLFG